MNYVILDSQFWANVSAGGASKANLAGGNTFTGLQTFNGGNTAGAYAASSAAVDVAAISGSGATDLYLLSDSGTGPSVGSNVVYDNTHTAQRPNAALGGAEIHLVPGSGNATSGGSYGSITFNGYDASGNQASLFYCDSSKALFAGGVTVGANPPSAAPGYFTSTTTPQGSLASAYQGALVLWSGGGVGTCAWVKEVAGGTTWASIKTGPDQNSMLFNNGVKVSTGTGAPNGSVVGSPGDMYLNKSGGAGTTLYVKESGSATSTGWVAK